MLTLIVARDRNGAIGKDNDIPWHAPEDLAFFKRETLGGAIIMGRNTWDSLPFKPLKDRLNLVVSTRGVAAEHVFPSLPEAIHAAQGMGYQRLYGIGGARVYGELLPIADRLLITEVDLEVEGADTFFPIVPEQAWEITGRSLLRAADPRCEVVEYQRRRA
ncbi:dihydrofolate reductase [Aliiroseovarius subalbicans]|uniref:dihydrofolate reductase n=1 Tax=Aliiroseovarius subalbicans TaxID=2925840 RepID=UPI001F570CA5|nr:dihydrofolate reductase [Aliiroseovarius subalbicans]MCI2397877.1 dihydrofolate reductase [Aliiroseovarius subalbicans]